MMRLLAANPNACVFAVGLVLVCSSVSVWSRPLAGTIAGVVLMAVAVWPYLVARTS